MRLFVVRTEDTFYEFSLKKEQYMKKVIIIVSLTIMLGLVSQVGAALTYTETSPYDPYYLGKIIVGIPRQSRR